MHGAAGLQQFPAGADVGSAFPVPVEIRTGEDAVLPIALLPYRDVRDDFLLLDQPAEELARPIGRVRGGGWRSRRCRLLSDPPLSFGASPSIAASASSAARYSATARFCRCFSVQ